MRTVTQVEPGRSRCRVPASALALLESARQGLAEAEGESAPGARYVGAHLAALRAIPISPLSPTSLQRTWSLPKVWVSTKARRRSSRNS